MPDFVVVTAFRSKDQMSKDLKKMGLSAKNFGKIAGLSFKKAERSALSLKKVIGGILGAAVLRRGFNLLQQGVMGVGEEFLNFDDAITAASAKFGVFDRESEVFKNLASTAREVGAATEFTSSQAAEGLRFLAKAGWESTAAMKALPSFVDLATASEMDFARAADIATDVMGAFRMGGTTTEQKIADLTRVNDVLSKAVNMANIDMEDMFETIKMAGPVANTAGIEIEKFSALTAFMGGAGIKGSLGGTAMRTMILSLTAPTKKAQALFKNLGIQISDSFGNMRDPIEILKDLNKGFDEYGSTQKTAAINTLFGKRAVSGAAVSMDGARGALQKFEEALQGAGGQSKKMAEFMRTALRKRLNMLQSAVLELGFKVLDAFQDKFPAGVDSAVEAIRRFDVKPIVQGIKDAIKFVRRIIPEVKDVVKDTIKLVREIIDVMQKAMRIASDYSGVLVGLGAAFVAMKLANVIGAIIQITKLLSAMKAAGGISGALSLVGVSPLILAITLAVAGLAAGVYTVVTRWDDLRQALGWYLEDLKAGNTVFSELANWQISVFENAWADIRGGFAQTVNWIISTARALGVIDFLGLSSGASAVEKMMGDLQKRPETATKKAPHTSWAGRLPDDTGLTDDFRLPTSQDPRLLQQVESQERAKAQAITFQGQLDIVGASPGSKMKSKTTGAPPIRTEMLGVNP